MFLCAWTCKYRLHCNLIWIQKKFAYLLAWARGLNTTLKSLQYHQFTSIDRLLRNFISINPSSYGLYLRCSLNFILSLWRPFRTCLFRWAIFKMQFRHLEKILSLYSILTCDSQRPPNLFSTFGISLMLFFKATVAPHLAYSNGYSNFLRSNENGSILW